MGRYKLLGSYFYKLLGSYLFSINTLLHGSSKHIDDRFHFLRDLSKDRTVMLQHCHIKE